MSIKEILNTLSDYKVEKEDAWTWMLTPKNHPDHRIEIFNNGEQYEISLLENTQGNRLTRGPRREVNTNDKQTLPDVIHTLTEEIGSE